MSLADGTIDDDRIGDREAEQPSSTSTDWSFLRRPRWVLSHVFAAALIITFVGAGLWQLDRLDQRQDSNTRIESRALQSAVPLDTLLADVDGEPDDALDFVAVTATGQFIESELARVANRSQDGRGGDWVVGVFETERGQIVAVNRGFVLRSETTGAAPDGTVEIEGFLRRSRTKGWIGGNDNPDSDRMPRLNIDDLAVRLDRAGLVDSSVADGGRLFPLWLQLTAIDGVAPSGAAPDAGVDAEVTPRPVPLGDLDEGNHFSYAVQWFLLATLSIVVYSLLLRRVAQRGRG